MPVAAVRPVGRRRPWPMLALTVLAFTIASATVGVRAAGGIAGPGGSGDIAWVESSGLWVGDPYGQRRTRVAPGSPYPGWYLVTAAWSQTGERLAHVLDNEIWVMNPDGSDRRRVVPAFGITEQLRSAPSWYAGDTKLLVVRSSPHRAGFLAWYTVDGTQSGEISLPGELPVWSARVSPDGTRIVLGAGTVEQSTHGIYTVGIDGSRLRRLTGGFGTDSEPFWSPDGLQIAFTNHYPEPTPQGTTRAIVMNADGSGGRLLRIAAIAIGWTPDGQALVARDATDGRDLTVRPNGTGPMPLGGCSPVTGAGFSWQPRLATPTGSVRAWGWNGVGQLGDGTTSDQRTPSLNRLSGVVAVVSGHYHSLALRRDGTVWGWGWNGVGQLGTGTTTDSHVPVPVPGLTAVTCLAAGAFHNLAVRSDGSVWTWGWNYFGTLGDGTTADGLRPRLVDGLRAQSVAGGIAHSLALGSDGTVWGWGWNGLGQVGNGSAYDSHRPVPVAGPGVGKPRATAIAAGGHHSLAAVNEGVLGWGWNELGQLGNGTTHNWVVPVAVAGLYGRVVQLAAGGYHSLALREDGALFAWGDNTAGELGDGSTTGSLQAKQVAQLPPVSAVSAGLLHSLAISRGALFTWGWNPLGQLGDGSVSDQPTPATVLGPPVNSISGGALHSLSASG